MSVGMPQSEMNRHQKNEMYNLLQSRPHEAVAVLDEDLNQLQVDGSKRSEHLLQAAHNGLCERSNSMPSREYPQLNLTTSIPEESRNLMQGPTCCKRKRIHSLSTGSAPFTISHCSHSCNSMDKEFEDVVWGACKVLSTYFVY